MFGNDVSITIGDVLQFITGASTIPAEGFDTKPSIDFHHGPAGEVARFPSANTCTCTLTLPISEGLLDESGATDIFFDAIIGSRMFGNV